MELTREVEKVKKREEKLRVERVVKEKKIRKEFEADCKLLVEKMEAMD